MSAASRQEKPLLNVNTPPVSVEEYKTAVESLNLSLDRDDPTNIFNSGIDSGVYGLIRRYLAAQPFMNNFDTFKAYAQANGMKGIDGLREAFNGFTETGKATQVLGRLINDRNPALELLLKSLIKEPQTSENE